MMQKMRCTYTELQAQPLEELLVFEQFMAGESEAQKAIADNK